jgi:RDD family.
MNEYKRANLNKRIIAFAIDAIVLWIGQLAIYGLYFGVGFMISVFNKTEFNPSLIGADIIMTISLCLFIFKDSVKGSSIGRKAVGIAVRDKDDLNKTPNFLRLAVRNLPLIILPIEFVILILSDEKMKRMGDALSNTEVIDLQINRSFSIF